MACRQAGYGLGISDGRAQPGLRLPCVLHQQLRKARRVQGFCLAAIQHQYFLPKALQLGAQRPEHGLLCRRTRGALQHGQHTQTGGARIADMQGHALMQGRATLKHEPPRCRWQTKG